MECFPRKFVTRTGQEFTINIALPEDLDEVTEFMQLHFFSTSPICYLVQNHQRRHNFKDYLFGYLRQLVSLTVRDSTSRLAGITINGLEEQTDVVVSSEAKSTTAVPNLVMSLHEALEEGIDLFEKYNTEIFLYLSMMAVDKMFGGLGLASKLVELSLELAKAHGAGAVKALVVSDFAAKVAAKQGLETIRTIDYATFEFNGDKPLAYLPDLLSEHPVARFMVRRIS